MYVIIVVIGLQCVKPHIQKNAINFDDNVKETILFKVDSTKAFEKGTEIVLRVSLRSV